MAEHDERDIEATITGSDDLEDWQRNVAVAQKAGLATPSD